MQKLIAEVDEGIGLLNQFLQLYEGEKIWQT